MPIRAPAVARKIEDAFNSLSRDHMMDRTMRRLVDETFNSLSRDHDKCHNDPSGHRVPFNSLSRDHSDGILVIVVQVKDLSTPSLGITRG